MFPTSSNTSTAQQAPIALSSFRIQTAVLGLVIPIVYGTSRISDNIINFDDFVAIAVTSTQPTASSGGGKGGPGEQQPTTTTSFIYRAAVQLGLCEGPIDGVGIVWQDKAVTTMATLGLALFNGTDPQDAWGYLVTHHPDKAIDYIKFAYVASATFALDSSAGMANYSFEVLGKKRYSPSTGLIDANPKDVIVDFLTDPDYGAQFPAERIGNLSAYSDYCVASGLLMSPIVDSQQEARQWLADWAKLTNSEWVSSSGLIRLVPYADEPVSGNGITYTPDLTPQYDLSDDDFQDNGGNDPVIGARTSPADASNSIKLEIFDRSNEYNTLPIEAKDQTAIEEHGLRQDSSLSAHCFTTAAAGQRSANLLLQRTLYVRNVYSFMLSWRHSRLDPLDYVTITDTAIGCDRQLVRMLTIDEDDSGLLSCTAEHVDVGTASPALHASQTQIGGGHNVNVEPPPTNFPMIVAAPIGLSLGLSLILVASGSTADWGGCNVWVSNDGANYTHIGRVMGSARQGVLYGGFNLGTDPDITNSCFVDLGMSLGEMLSGTPTDADHANTLCVIIDADGGSEFFSHSTAQLTGLNRYMLGQYIRRGQYNTPIRSHVAGARFARLDEAVFVLPYTVDQIGTVMYVKLPAFNPYGAATEQLSDVPGIPFLCPAPPIPPDVTNFGAVQNGEVVNFSWALVADSLLASYDIRYGPAGSTLWDAMIPLAESSQGTAAANASVPNGNWTFAIRAVDIAGQFSQNPNFVTRSVFDSNPILSADEQAPAWAGTLMDCTVDTGADDVLALVDFLGAEIIGSGSLVPDDGVESFSYEAPILGFTKKGLIRCAAAVAAELLPGEVGAPRPLVYARYSEDIVTDPLMWDADSTTPMWTSDTTPMWTGFGPYELWTKGIVRTAAVQMKVVSFTATGRCRITSFVPTVDQPPLRDAANGVSIPAGGARITFAMTDFLTPPFTQATAQTVGLNATASDVDADGFTAHVVNSSGTDVGGLINWTARN